MSATSDDDPAVPERADPAVPTSAPREADRAATYGDAAAGTGAPVDDELATEEKHGRPTGWIVLCAVLALAVVGLGIWALGAQSSADDSEAKLAAATAAVAAGNNDASGAEAATPTPAATATPAPTAAPAATPDAATQQELDELTAAMGQTNENLGQIQQDLEKAAAGADQAKQEKANASNALERAKADLQGFKADAQLTSACLRGTLEAMKTAFASGGAQAAVDELKALSGNCRGSAS